MNKKQQRAKNGRTSGTSSTDPQLALMRRIKAEYASQRMVSNSHGLRSLAGLGLPETHEGRRKPWEVFGYPPIIDIADYRLKYLRTIGGRIVDLYAEDTWKKPPPIWDGQSNETPFVTAWDKLVKDFGIWEVMTRLDKVMQLGQFALLWFGFDDIEDMDLLKTPVDGKVELRSLRVISEAQVDSASLDENPSSERFGLPETYNLTFGKTDTNTTDKFLGLTRQVVIHHTRLLHVVEGALDNNLEGLPRLQRPFNTLQSLEMIVGSIGEGFWRNVSRRYAFEAREGWTSPDNTDDIDALEDEIFQFVHNMRDEILLDGYTMNTEPGQDVNGNGAWEPVSQQLAGEVAVPFRILFGSERGEQASSQDQSNWAGTINSRQITQTEPNQLRPFVNRLVDLGILPQPDSGSYDVGIRDSKGQFSWIPITEVSAEEEASIAQTRASAAKTAQEAIIAGATITPTEIRDDFAGLTPIPASNEPQGEALTQEGLEEMVSDE